MTINITVPNEDNELAPNITVVGVGGAGCNAVNNMISANLGGVNFISTNTDAQALKQSMAERRIQLGAEVTQGLGAGSRPDVGRAAAEESIEDILDALNGANMCFITAGMGGGTGTGAAPVIARAARERGILTVGVVTKPFHFEGQHRMRLAEGGIEELTSYVDTLIIIPNQNLFRIANEKTTFADAFNMADDVLHSGVRGVTDLMVMPGLINLDFADIRTVMSEMGKAMMGTGEASGEKRAIDAAEAAINNPLLEDASMKGAKGVLINITGGFDMTLFEVDEAANRIREEVDSDANIIFGSTFDEKMEGVMRVSVVATGIAAEGQVAKPRPQLSVVTPRPVKQPEPEPVPETAIRAEAAQMAPAQKPAASMSTLDITRQAESGIGELSFPDSDDYAEVASLDDSAEQTREAAQVEEAEIVDAAAPAVAKVASDAFVPSASTVPQRRPDMTPKAADPFRGSDMVNASRPEAAEPAPKSRGAGLFRQITGLGLKNDKPAEAPAPQPQQAQRPAAASASQPRLGALNPGDRVRASQNEDEMLDIPAFLRRQAN
ncbi:cell division protein FtsZ [Thalassobaculum litoreum]|uniref:Cell division protein FtsZ n=1 Tax=Thalassobaculum litoreum DSM 18839 TaxID=1123362 RepID=A0A8G2BIU0_9PROT|nr:cell division protein FtsZ [Thalassobaculum litoreum]SDF85991.1 cell division protein FtsZ [Thalassobaculum litoreum DSM 18839]